MLNTGLIAYWIKSPCKHAPLGFGATAKSLDDALNIIRTMGFERYLPNDLKELIVTENVTINDLDDSYVKDHMGPIVVRGMWYPFIRVGPPPWME